MWNNKKGFLNKKTHVFSVRVAAVSCIREEKMIEKMLRLFMRIDANQRLSEVVYAETNVRKGKKRRRSR